MFFFQLLVFCFFLCTKSSFGLTVACKAPETSDGPVLVHYQFLNKNKKETVIFVNGNGESLETFLEVSRMIKGFNILLYDLRGQGASDYQGVDFTIGAMVGDLRLLTDSLHLNAVHIVGHSFGARIAIAYAALYPDLVKSVTVEDMDFIARGHSSDQSIENLARRMLSLHRTYSSREEALKAIESIYGNDSQFLEWVVSQSRIHELSDHSVVIVSTPYQQMIWGEYANAADLGCAYRDYSGPVLFLRADPSMSAMSQVGINELFKIKPKTRLISFPGSSHSIHQSMPIEYAKVIKRFLRFSDTIRNHSKF